MEYITVSRIKQSLKTIWHKEYVSFETKKKWEIVVTSLCNTTLVSGILILFIIGGSIYAKEHPKELTYAQNICQVHTTSYRQYWCSRRGSNYRCYAPVWDVVYGENQTINATIVGDNRYSSQLDAIKKTNEYQVSYSKQYLINNLIVEIFLNFSC
jgi:hypothetical protein